MRNNCFSDQEKLLKFEAEGRESLEQFIQAVKRSEQFLVTEYFFNLFLFQLLGMRNMHKENTD